jgi:NADPH-dependent ferric siderophore reductase
VTLAAKSLVGTAFEAGADVAFRLSGHAGIEERRYSVWKTDADAGTFDVCVVLHGLGPGSRWAERCALGDEVEFLDR